MTDEISARVIIGRAEKSQISGTELESSKQVLGKVNTDVQVTDADSSDVSGAKIKLHSADTGDLQALKKDFQSLLKSLNENELTRPTDVATLVVKKELEKKPDLKQRLFNALKAGGLEALKFIFEHPAVSISTEAIKAFLEDS
jgi:hypothetical protein